MLEGGLKWEQIGVNARDAQYLEGRSFSRSDIAMFFGVPPHMIGDVERSTSWGSGIEQQEIGFLQTTMEPWLTTWEQEINRQLLYDDDTLFAEFLRKAILRADVAAETESHRQYVDGGILSVNEVRAQLNLNPNDDAIIRGTGAGMPLGFFTGPSIVSVAKESGQPAATIVVGNVLKMWARMPARLKPGSVWLIHSDLMTQLPQMSIGQQPVWLPPGGLIKPGAPVPRRWAREQHRSCEEGAQRSRRACWIVKAHGGSGDRDTNAPSCGRAS